MTQIRGISGILTVVFTLFIGETYTSGTKFWRYYIKFDAPFENCENRLNNGKRLVWNLFFIFFACIVSLTFVIEPQLICDDIIVLSFSVRVSVCGSPLFVWYMLHSSS